MDEPVAGHTDKNFVALAQDFTVSEALAQIRRQSADEQIIYFYAVDDAQRLAGVLPTRRLLLAAPEARLRDIMINRVVAIPATASVLDACELFLMYKYLAFPVVDAERHILGVVNVSLFAEETLGLSDGEGTERRSMDEVFEQIGFRVAEVQKASSWQAFRLRFPWLVATLSGGICCALVAGAFEATLATRIILAFFLTLVLGLSESVSAQSVIVTVEALRGRTPDRAWLLRAARKELATALMLGGACGLVVGLVAWLWRGQGVAAAVIGGSIAVSMVMACLIGLVVPAGLHRFKLDPKIAAGPVSLALADILTLLIYLNLAARLL